MARFPRRPVPEPLDTNAVPVLLTGTALWAVAGLVLLIVRPAGHDWWLWACLAGVLAGVALLGYERWRRGRIARRGNPTSRAARAPADTSPKRP